MSDPYRVLVTGSRTWDDILVIAAYLERFAQAARKDKRAMVIVHGHCPKGADKMADAWVRARASDGWPVTAERHPADWNTHGKAAGHRRNQHMVDLGADACLAFIRDGSPGATGCARMAEKAGIPVAVVDYDRRTQEVPS